MQIKLSTLDKSQAALVRLSQEKFAPATTLKIMRVMRAVRPELEDYNKMRSLLLVEFCPKTPDGLAFTLTPKYIAEMEKLETELDLPIEKLPVSLLDKEISADDLIALEWLIDFGEVA